MLSLWFFSKTKNLRIVLKPNLKELFEINTLRQPSSAIGNNINTKDCWKS